MLFLENMPVVALHGWGMHGAIFAGVAENHWLLPSLPALDLSACVDALAAAAPPRIVLLGWSMGSLIAQAWAQRYPQQVAALVLVSATPCFQQRADWPFGLAQADVDAFAAGVASDWRATLNRFLSLQARGSEDARSLIAQLRGAVNAHGAPTPEALAAGMRLLQETDLRDQAAHIAQPTLLIHGDRDGLCPLAGAQWLAGQIPNARLAMIEGAAHAPFLSHPQAFSALLKGFADAA